MSENQDFNELVLKYQDRVFNLCYRFMGNYEEADDCAQEVFLKVYRSLKDFRGESSLSTWVYRIAVNTCKNRLMSREYRERKRTISIDAPVQTEEGEVGLEIKDESRSPARELDAREKDALIQEAIAALPEDQRQVVVLRDIEALSYEEIAGITGLNIGTVKSKLSRARQALCEKLRRLI
ncbi:MAG TPA: sigma-70 family RNA polymerase sigma factor [Candidatus Omnitrophota bacterium]|nr:sigma-70 family RNA polymerase sigma factor [Candidatus Omnitrophota bacterium]HRZ14706.1 sigma-70 family RNA polymerase sigma factor [Candidatus Omnitrophota bacterium]